MVEEFKKYYKLLPYPLQDIISNTLLTITKTHNTKSPKKIINLRQLVKYYCNIRNISTNQLKKTLINDYGVSENTYDSIMKRNLVNIKDNPTIELVFSILNIPTDNNGLPYIENDTFSSVSYPLTSEYQSYLREFQDNTPFDNFLCLSNQNQHAILYLTQSLYRYITSPETFEQPKNDDYT